MKRICLFILPVLFFIPMIARAQVATGMPPFGTFGGGPDVIDLANLNAQLVVPVLNKQGRGMPFVFNITHDSSVWMPVTSGSSQTWQPVGFPSPQWGWNTTEANIGTMTFSASVVETPEFCNNGTQEFMVMTTYHNWIYTDGFNIAHSFGKMTSDSQDDQCTGIITNDPGFGGTVDGSGYSAQLSGSTVTQLLGPDGSSITPNTGAGSIEDRNGNLISIASSGVVTDTLGQTAITQGGTISTGRTFTYVAPSGANASYTLKYTSYTVKTNFGCSGINEYGPTSQSLVSEIDLPDINIHPNDRYVITYETTPGFSGDITGRIASITLPTGGTISYSYSGGTGSNNSGIVCADGSTATLTRMTGDGTWSYAHTESGQDWSTTITDPQGNETIYNFVGIYQTERKVYQGSTTVLEDDVTCYNGNTTNCNTTGFSLPITERIATDTLGTRQCQHVYKYNGTNGLTEQDDYDYGNGAPGSLLRKELITYASLGNNIANAPSQVQIENGSGIVIAQTNVTYDGTSVVATSGTPQHLSISGSRGNPTSVVFTVAGSNTLTKSFTYFDTGNVDVATDVNGAQTGITYGACGNSFPTSISEPLSLSKSMVWNCIGGVETSATDENSQTVSAAYSDAYFWRPASSSDQENNTTNFSYPNQNSVESALVFNSGNSTTDILTTLDGQGRTLVTQKRQSPSATSFDSVETDYDSLGRPSRTTVPYSGTAGQTNGSAPATTQTYDGLSRPFVTMDGGGGTATLTFSVNDMLQTIGPAPTGENTKQRQSEYNSIGQLTSVCEVTSLTGSGTCAQNISATGYWTTYAYDVLGDLLTVTQNAQAQVSSQQPRNYTYDGLGRMTSEANPETGNVAVYYFYDSDPGTKGSANCSGTFNGDLVKRVDAAGNVTCYVYDALHRQTSITYPSGPNSGSNSPGKFFVYDAATVNSVAMANAKARLAEAYTATCSTCSKITDEGFSYSLRGEVATEYESTPHSGGYYTASATYWANGLLDSLTGTASYSTTYTPDGEGRVNSAAGAMNQLKSTTYNAASEPLVVTLGNSDSDTFTYDPNTFRMTQYKYTIGATPQSLVGTLTWNPNGTLQQLAITDPFNATNTQTCNYTHDDLARIASGNCGSVWSQTFSYDAFGNITKAGTNSFNPGYNPATNRMSSGATYDTNGDVLTDSLHSFAWDSAARPTTIDTVTATYDALGRMVEQTKAGVSTELQYAPTGFMMQELNVQTKVQSRVPLPGGAVLVSESGAVVYQHADWLGGSRFASRYSDRTMFNDLAYAPFGEQYAKAGNTGIGNVSFAGNNGDTATNLYDAQFREYEITGRWPSPDPAGTAAANPANPQSWNRYAYALNSPLNLIDPEGLAWVPSGGPYKGSGCLTNNVTDEVWCPPPGGFFDPFFLGEPEPFIGGDTGGGGGGGNGPSSPQNSKLKCIAGAVGFGLLTTGIDAIGVLPEGGIASTAISKAVGKIGTDYKGIVAIQQGTKTVNGVTLANGIVSTGLGSQDSSGLGVASTAVGVFSIAATIAKVAPGVGQVLSGLSVVVDLVKTGVAIAHCQ